ncbi:MAG TPA: ABC transporter permease subunit [Anaerolineales bacterium]|nr:ABC transporter permease subunit [Anaerolineales bacterium]
MSLFAEFRKEWKYLLRSYRLLVAAIVLLFFGLTSPIMAKFTPELVNLIPTGGMTITMPPPTVMDAIGQYVKNMAQDGILLGLLLTMGAIAQEKDKGTAAMMLVKPLPRGSFLWAKFLSLASMFAICLAISGLAAYYYTMLLFQSMNIGYWLVLNVLLFVYYLVIVSITLLCSTITRSQGAAIGIAFGLLVIGWFAGGILRLGKFMPGELVTWGMRLMQGDTTSSWTALGVSLGLIVVPLLAAWLIFKKQEL